jgi:signal transduction histidine kinase/CheY-like chemotaxis protein
MKDNLKILLLEDSATDAELIRRLLHKQNLNCTIMVVINKPGYIDALEHYKPTLILSDHSLPAFNSREALQMAREYYPNIPFILVTGTVSEEFAADIIKQGADDYILKDRMARLPAAVSAAFSKRKKEREHEEKMAIANRQVQTAEERERIAIESAHIGIYDLVVASGKLVSSARYNDIFGFDETVPRRDYLALIHPEDLTIREKAFEAAKVTGRLSYEVRIVKKDQSVSWIRAGGIIYKNKHGVPERIIGSVIDITEFKYLLKQKDNFLAAASHELKTPLTTIKVCMQLLSEMVKESGNETSGPLIVKIDRQVGQLSSIINNLLDSTKMISGELQLNHSAFEIDQMLADVISGMQLITDKKILVEPGCPGTKVWADRYKIEQVIINLVTNASKFSAPGQQVFVRSVIENDKVRIEVEDFGIGIREDNLEKIFQQYFREDLGTKYTYPGLGLGLFISSEIIKKDGGKISVRSKEGAGSTFSFLLPIAGRTES